MRTYRKPTIDVEMFEVNRNVATNCLTTTTNTQVTAVTVDCIKDGYETIFTQGTSGCVKITTVGAAQIVPYGGKKYYVWPFPNGEIPSQGGARDDTMEAVLQAYGLSADAAARGGYHVGELDSGDIKIINAS